MNRLGFIEKLNLNTEKWNDMTEEEKVAYTNGYMEALRWRYPEKELPKKVGKVLVSARTMLFDGTITETIDLDYWDGEFRYYLDDVVKWRPIE